WGVVSVGACLLGVGTKEVAVTAPLFVLLADRVFFCDSILAALRKRPLYYLALAATWLPLAGLVLSTGGDRGGTFTWGGSAFLNYWLTQPEALTRYLGLALWPHPLIFEYGVAANGNPLVVAGCTLVVLLFMALTVGLWWRRRPEALGLGAFLLVLAPTSLLPGMQIIVEHRMYLPLAGLMAVLVAATTAWLGRRGLVACAVLALLGGLMTAARNRVYQDPLLLWSDTVAKRPSSAKAQNNLGLIYHRQGNLDAAIQHYELAVKLEPAVAQTRFNFALALRDAGRSAEAIQAYTEAVRILPHFFQAHALLGVLLAKEGDPAASRHLQVAYDLNPELAEVHLGMGLLLAANGRNADAVQAFERALQLAPGLADARLGLGVVLAKLGRLPEASKQLKRLTAEVPALAEAHANLGIVLAESGELEASIACYREALRLKPGHATAHYNLGNSLVQLQRWAEAREEFETAVRLKPDFSAAQGMLDRMKSVDLR
ncbi:MAG TPA: tetratricopeptide repeat protein, partial [Lacunisphaera sp.]|nr:tetratricopeptide repeat protein [Lacunisphaera sp.]